MFRPPSLRIPHPVSDANSSIQPIGPSRHRLCSPTVATISQRRRTREAASRCSEFGVGIQVVSDGVPIGGGHAGGGHREEHEVFAAAGLAEGDPEVWVGVGCVDLLDSDLAQPPTPVSLRRGSNAAQRMFPLVSVPPTGLEPVAYRLGDSVGQSAGCARVHRPALIPPANPLGEAASVAVAGIWVPRKVQGTSAPTPSTRRSEWHSAAVGLRQIAGSACALHPDAARSVPPGTNDLAVSMCTCASPTGARNGPPASAERATSEP